MTWITQKGYITTILNANNYKEVEHNISIDNSPKSRRDRGYTLKPIEIETESLTNGSYLGVDGAELRISRICNTNSESDRAYDEFKSILTSIYQYISTDFTATWEGDEENNKYFIGTANFTVGAQVCN